jgi:hypothetical protein
VAEKDDIALLPEIYVLHQGDELIFGAFLRASAERRYEARADLRGSFLETDELRSAKVKAVGASVNKVAIDKVLVLFNTEVAGANLWPPTLAVLARCNALEVTSVQGRNTNLGDLIMCSLIRLDIDAHEDHGTVECERDRSRGVDSSRHALRDSTCDYELAIER